MNLLKTRNLIYFSKRRRCNLAFGVSFYNNSFDWNDKNLQSLSSKPIFILAFWVSFYMIKSFDQDQNFQSLLSNLFFHIMQTYPARNKYPECFLDDNKILSFCRPILFCTLPYDSILNPTLWFYFAPYPIQHSKFKIVNELKDPGVLFFGSRNTEEIHRRSYLGAK